jgi:hypothetical protein
MAQPTVNLGTATSFAVLAGTGITNTGTTKITGDVGTHPTSSETGFGSVTIIGTNHVDDAVTQGAKNDLVTAYNDAASRIPATTKSGDIGGQTLTPGVYNSLTSLGITGTLTLDAQGDSNAVFIFQLAVWFLSMVPRLAGYFGKSVVRRPSERGLPLLEPSWLWPQSQQLPA